MRLLRLSGRKVCERVKLRGMLWKGRHCQARCLPLRTDASAPLQGGILYVGTLTSARLDKSAVRRNRMRRRCREALRISLPAQDASPSWQLLLMPRSSSLSAPFSELSADARALLSFLSSPRAYVPYPVQKIHA